MLKKALCLLLLFLPAVAVFPCLAENRKVVVNHDGRTDPLYIPFNLGNVPADTVIYVDVELNFDYGRDAYLDIIYEFWGMKLFQVGNLYVTIDMQPRNLFKLLFNQSSFSANFQFEISLPSYPAGYSANRLLHGGAFFHIRERDPVTHNDINDYHGHIFYDLSFTIEAPPPPPPVLSLDMQSVALGDVILGESGSAGFTISNGAGCRSLEVTDITSSDGEFTVSPTQAVIAGGASQLFTVDFKPGSLGDQTAALTITSNDGVHTVTVTGTGVAAPPPPQPPPPPTQPGAAIRVDCNVYNFGTVRVGSSTDLPLVLTNTGDQTLVVSDIRASSAEFSVVPASGSVAPDGSLEAGVVFHPVSAGSKTVRLTVSSNAINGPEVLVDFIGVVESGPNLSIEQPGPYIGSIPVGRSIYTGFTISNVGDEELQVYSITCGGEIFTVNDTAFTLQPGQGVPVDLSFLPVEGGYHDAEVVVSSSDPDRGSVTLDFRGHGKTAPDIQLYMGGDILSMGRVEVGVPGVDYIFVVNNGREDLEVSSLACDNPSFLFMPQQFTVMADSASRISVYFSPAEPGLQSAEATLSCNDPDRESLSATIPTARAFRSR